ncbi:uncharacterized protein LOC125941445 [Dermacentor silvarum]|uniref:uncharacterized protein LOC125941445 n=1 Tax=Dermacentor silvarum TaxID=543639 RepID=UPI002101307E|nr:uncharacterized protein LOC125941445 [Dermacentor silvarum]
MLGSAYHQHNDRGHVSQHARMCWRRRRRIEYPVFASKQAYCLSAAMHKQRGTPRHVPERSVAARPAPSNATTVAPVIGGRHSDHNGAEEPSNDAPKRLTLPHTVEDGSHREGSGTAAKHRHAEGMEHGKSQESLQPESPRHSQGWHSQQTDAARKLGSHGRNRKNVQSGGYAEVPRMPATFPQPTTDSRREFPRHDVIGTSPSVVHGSGGAHIEEADVPVPSSVVHLEPSHEACYVHEHATHPIPVLPSVETQELSGHTNAPHQAQHELPPPLVCKISVPHFAGESKYFEDGESEQTDWLHPTSMTNTCETSSRRPQRRIGNGTLATAPLAPPLDATESPVTGFHAKEASSSVRQIPSFSDMRDGELHSVRTQLEHPDRPSANTRAKRDGSSHATPSFSRFRSASLSLEEDAFRSDEPKGRKMSWPATGASAWSSGESSRSPRKDTATPAVSTVDLPETPAGTKFVTAQSSPSPSSRLEFPDQSTTSEQSPQTCLPFRPPSALADSPERWPLRPQERHGLEPPWMKKVQGSDAPSSSFHSNTTSAATPSSWTRGSSPQLTGRRDDVPPECGTRSRKQLRSLRFLSSTMQVKAALLEAGILWPRMPRDSDTVDVLGTWLRASLTLHWSVVLDVFVQQTENSTRVALRPLREFERIVEKHQRLTRSDQEAQDYFDTLRHAGRSKYAAIIKRIAAV